MNKQKLLKTLRNIGISMAVMIVTIAGLGVGYVWYMGQQPSGVVEAAPPPVSTKPTRLPGDPIKPDPNANVGASVQSISSPVAPGDNATMTVRTTPTAVCAIVAKYGETVSKDTGLQEKAADEYGMVSWTWTVESSVPLGQWPVRVTCTYNEKSAMVQGILVVANQP